MADSSLDPDNLTAGRDRIIGLGHGTRALGPSDTSDSGSDLLGAPGLAQQVGFGREAGTTSDPEAGTASHTAGPDVGDADLDSDTDSAGTGERASAARDTVARDGGDIDVDHVESINPGAEPYDDSGDVSDAAAEDNFGEAEEAGLDDDRDPASRPTP
jgi:hypothetical protein